jgi:hypothetical protein
MMKSLSSAAPWVVMAGVAIVYLGWGLAPSSPLYVDLLTPRVLLAAGAVAKLIYLLAGSLWAFGCRDRLDAGNPARPGWALLSLGLLATFVGQLGLAPFQIVQGVSPFPSVVDLYYVLSYPFFIAAFLIFLHAYRESGLPMGSAAEQAAIAGGVAVLAVVVGVIVLRPIAATQGPLLDHILMVTYPILDLVLLVPLALLLRVALRLRGSRVGAVWTLLLGGFLFLCLGDVFFAYFQALGQEHLDPFLHATYILSYGLVAGGTRRQLQLLKA